MEAAKTVETPEDFRAGIDAALAQLEGYSAQVGERVSLTRAAVEAEVAKANPETGTNELVSPEKVREVLGPKFLSIKALNEELRHDGLMIADETTPINNGTENVTEAQFLAWVADAQKHTRKREDREDNLPLLMRSFTKIREIESGKEITPDLNWMENFLATTEHPRLKGKSAFFDEYITKITKESIGNGGYAWLYSDGVAGSNNMTESQQETFMEEKFGSKEMAPDWDLFVASVFYYAKTGIWLFDDIWVRLEAKDTDVARAYFSSVIDSGKFYLDYANPDDADNDLYASCGGRSPVISQ